MTPLSRFVLYFGLLTLSGVFLGNALFSLEAPVWTRCIWFGMSVLDYTMAQILYYEPKEAKK